jgi:uncharacterized membrane protein YhaH (DUF805 family)
VTDHPTPAFEAFGLPVESQTRKSFMFLALNRYADFDGRSGRKEFWMFYLFVLVGSITLTLTDISLDTFHDQIGFGLLSGLFTIAVLVPSISVGVRRLHDLDRSGWWLLLGFVPVIGIVLVAFWCMKGIDGPNKYGNPPQSDDLDSNVLTQLSDPDFNPKISFNTYRMQQKISRPGFSHMSRTDQQKEWIDHLKKLSTHEKTSDQKQVTPPSNPKVESVSTPLTTSDRTNLSVEERLQKVGNLLSAGLITKEEASSKRSKILDDL